MNSPIGSFEGIFSSYGEALALARQRQELLSLDSSNLLTPGYVSQGNHFDMYLKKSSNKRLPSDNKKGIMHLMNMQNSGSKVDRNGVDYEATLMATKETEMHYVSVANILNREFNILENALKEVK